MKVEEILKDLVAFNTINDQDNLKIMQYVKDYLEKLNFRCTLYGADKKILVATIKEKQTVGFVGHTDTVSYRNTFGGNPFKLTENNGNLYGLGTSDMKGGIAAILKAVAEIDFAELKYGMTIILTYDEEISFGGIKYFKSLNLNYPEYLIIGEPTDNVPMNGSKGVIEYEFRFNGISSHSSMPIESSNVKCVKFLNELLKLESYFHKSWCDEYEFGHTTMNYGIINGGERVNIVPNYTKATCDFRITKDVKEYNHIKKYVNALAKKHNIEYIIKFDFLPFYNNDEIIKYYEKITNKKCKKFFGLSEASVLNKNKIILGPGPITAHKDNEHISRSSLNETVRIYKKILLELCNK